MSITQESLYSRWGTLLSDETIENYYCASGFDHPAWPVICADNPARIELLGWGLIPFWVKDDEKAQKHPECTRRDALREALVQELDPTTTLPNPRRWLFRAA